MIISSIRQLNSLANNHAGKLLFIGLAAVSARNWQLWQDDRVLAEKIRAERTQLPELKRTPKINVLVAAWNESSHIETHLRSFLDLSYPDIELILCAGGTDDTFERALRYTDERITIIKQHPGEGKQHSLARCFELAKGEIIYLTDADCVYSQEPFLRLIAPIINEGEQVTTGTSRPLDEQLNKLLPIYLWTSDIVANYHSPYYIKGLLGRNAAMSRQALDKIGGLNFEAVTGTDYQLAQRLLASGFSIRHVKDSIVPTEYPENFKMYQRKQSRWLRNLLIYGKKFNALQDVQASQRTVLTGIIMLFLPLTVLLFGLKLLILWFWLLTYAVLSKIRYLFFTDILCERPVHFKIILCLFPLTIVDFYVWSWTLVDLFTSVRREKW